MGFILAIELTGAMGGLSAAAQAPPAETKNPDAVRIAALEEKLRQMEERLRDLENRLAGSGDKVVATTGAIPAAAVRPPAAPASPAAVVLAGPAQAASPATPIAAAGPEGFSLRSADGQFRLNLRYQMNVDSRFAVDRSTGEPNSIFLRRAQPILAGTVFRRFDYLILTEFAQGRPRVNDAYMEIAFAPALRLRAGKYKVPVGLERLRSGMALTVAERGLSTQLVPNRDLGVQLYGDLAGGRISYAAGVFNGLADAATGDGDTDDAKEFAARFFAHPFLDSGRKPLEGLGVGIATSRGHAENLPRYSTTGGTTFFEYANAEADGIRYRYAPQAYYYYGRLGLMGEYVLSSQEIHRKPSSGLAAATFRPKNIGWHVQGSFFLTRDTASYGPEIPGRNFEPGNGTFGAFELAARYTELRVDSGVFVQGIGGGLASQAKAWALGLNWYMNRDVRLLFQYEQTEFQQRPGLASVPMEKVFLQRFQLKF